MKSTKLIAIILLPAFLFMAWISQQPQQPETMPLVPMMRLLLSDMYTINEGMYTENYELIMEGGTSIANHPVMTEEDKKLIKSTLGDKMKQFVNYDMVVHHHADSIRLAAERQQMDEVIRHYTIVQKGCIDCHSAFRTKIIEARQQ